MVKKDKKVSRVKSALLDLRELKSESLVLLVWMDLTEKRVNPEFVDTLEETVLKEVRENLVKVDSLVPSVNPELTEMLVQQDHVVAQEVLVRMVPLVFLVYQV